MRNQMIEVKEPKQIATFQFNYTSSKNKGAKFFLWASGNTRLFNISNFFVHSFLGLMLFLKVCRADWQSIRVYCPSINMKRVGKLMFTDFDWFYNSYQDCG